MGSAASHFDKNKKAERVLRFFVFKDMCVVTRLGHTGPPKIKVAKYACGEHTFISLGLFV